MRAWTVGALVIAIAMADADARADAKANAHAKANANAHAKANAEVKVEPLVISETSLAPRTDYQAETYSGVPLDAPYAKQRGLAKGLVYMVFEHQRRPAFRVGHERINKLVKLVEAAQASVVIAKSTMTTRIDVLDTKDGIVVVETTTTNAGIFTSSDVYVFPREASPAQRHSSLESMAPTTRDRIRAALAIALR